MFSNYLKTALRNFNRNKVIFVINLSGLAIGLATCIVAALFVKHEYETDKFHTDINSIFRVSTKFKTFQISGTPYVLTESLQRDIEDVKSTLRTNNKDLSIRIGETIFNHEVIFADTNFFSFFTFPLQSGNPSSALTGLQKVVISSEIQTRYFSGNPLGQVIGIKVNNVFEDFEITGITKPIPSQSSIDFDFIIPLENRYLANPGEKDSWMNFHLTTFVKVPEGQLNQVLAKMPDFIKRNMAGEEAGYTSFVFNPLRDHHLSEGSSGGPLKAGKSDQSLKVFAGVSLLILLLAGFNFMNLTNAQSSRRIVEVGIRKVAGAGKKELMKQFLTESIATTFFAGFLSLGLAQLSLTLFKHLLEVSISVFDTSHPELFIGLAIVIFITGILAGGYPSFVLSNLKTINAFKKHYRVGGSNWLTRSVLSMQFVLSIVLIACAIIMWRQQQFLINKELGYNKDQVVMIPVLPADTSSITLLKNELKQSSEVSAVALSSSAFSRGNNATMATFPDGEKRLVFMQSIDNDFIPTLGMKIIAGENFHDDKTYNPASIIVNESFMNTYNLWDSIGMKIGQSIGHIASPTIVGVVQDFHFNDLTQGIAPFMFMRDQRLHAWYLTVRLQAGKISSGVKNMEATWKKINPNSPFEYFFLDEDIAAQYKDVQRWSTIISISTGMAIFLSILGMLGLAIFTAEQRRKEVGIRKVLGASVQQLVILLSGKYAVLIFIAFIFAVPASYYLMTNFWLNTFAFKTDITITVYLIALAIVVVIVALPVGTQTVRAALQNPADTLKEE
jgi:putative ABC transport system permease protein